MLLLRSKNFDERIKNVKVIYMDIGDLFYHTDSSLTCSIYLDCIQNE